MAKYDVLYIFSAVAFMLKLASAYPSMTSSIEQTPPSSMSSVTLNLDPRALHVLMMSLNRQRFLTDSYLNQTINDKIGADMMVEIVKIVLTESNPHIPNNAISDAEHCRNIQNVLNTTASVLSGYSAMVQEIPTYCFNKSVLYSSIQSVEDKVRALMVQNGQPREPTPSVSTTRDVFHAIKTLAALQIQNENILKIVQFLQKCPSS